MAKTTYNNQPNYPPSSTTMVLIEMAEMFISCLANENGVEWWARVALGTKNDEV